MNTATPAPRDNSYIGVSTPHVKEASRFYIEHFGYSIVSERPQFTSVISPNGKRCIGFSLPSESDLSDEQPIRRDIHLSFLVDDASQAISAFRSAGIKITKDLDTGDWGAPHFVVTDPAGIDLYISEKAMQS